MPVEFTVKYDITGDALYIKIKDDRVVESDEIAPGIIIDYNDKGEIVGVEVLWVSRRKIDLAELAVKGPEALVAKA